MRAGEGWTANIETFDCLGEIAGHTVDTLSASAAVARILSLQSWRCYGARFGIRPPRRNRMQLPNGWLSCLAEADIVSLHLPLNGETEKLLDAAAIASMKRKAVLINTSAGRPCRRSGVGRRSGLVSCALPV